MTELVIKGSIVFETDSNFQQVDDFLKDFEDFLQTHKVELNGIVRSYQFDEDKNSNETENNRNPYIR